MNFSLDLVLLVTGTFGFATSLVPLIGRHYHWPIPVLVAMTVASLSVESVISATVTAAVLGTDFQLSFSRAFSDTALLSLLLVFATYGAPGSKRDKGTP